jgi:hydroxymethylglutaryl-CoA synthase
LATGIVSYGAYIPKRRISVDDIARQCQNASPATLRQRLRISERAVLGPDEDTITLALDAAEDALLISAAAPVRNSITVRLPGE